MKVTPEGIPSLALGAHQYSLWFSVYGIQRWAEHRDVDYQQALEDGWQAGKLSLADLTKLLEIALAGGEARRAAFEGGDPRTIGPDTLQSILAVYSHIELAVKLAEAWAGLPEGEKSDPNSPEPHA